MRKKKHGEAYSEEIFFKRLTQKLKNIDIMQGLVKYFPILFQHFRAFYERHFNF